MNKAERIIDRHSPFHPSREKREAEVAAKRISEDFDLDEKLGIELSYEKYYFHLSLALRGARTSFYNTNRYLNDSDIEFISKWPLFSRIFRFVESRNSDFRDAEKAIEDSIETLKDRFATTEGKLNRLRILELAANDLTARSSVEADSGLSRIRINEDIVEGWFPKWKSELEEISN